ncbi:MAG: hypothetical protein LIO58_09240 [Oscillospiraceae bacterium]|nr:hypothetical protein [Oscillospiraceae bacterium]
MSSEVIKQVTEAEQSGQMRKTEAVAAAKRTVLEAERDGQALLAESNLRAETQAKEMMAQAEEEAKKHANRVMTETKNTCKSLQTSAEGRMSQAVALIVRRVVNA